MFHYKRTLRWASLALLAVLGLGRAQEIYGWIEPVGLPGAGLRLMAKLDTGADTSSLDANAIRRVKRGDRRLVRFQVRDPESGDMIELEREYVRSARIVRHSGTHQIRHVVNIEICLGEMRRKIEVNLIDRSNFAYAFLLGRNALSGIALVDPSATETTEPVCDDVAAAEDGAVKEGAAATDAATADTTADAASADAAAPDAAAADATVGAAAEEAAAENAAAAPDAAAADTAPPDAAATADAVSDDAVVDGAEEDAARPDEGAADAAAGDDAADGTAADGAVDRRR